MRQTQRLARNVFALLLGAAILLPLTSTAQTGWGSIDGTLTDRATGVPVAFAQILLEGAERSTQTTADGDFMLRNVPPGTYVLRAFRIGYEPLVKDVEVGPNQVRTLQLQMRAEPVRVGEIVVHDIHETRERHDVEGTSSFSLGGTSLRERLGATIAETLEKEPGVSMRSMGPAPARPVLRGLGGERLLVLEDGERTGDLSSTSSDHAVAIDPLMMDEIEVLRGPSALLHGPSVLGGVVNVLKNAVPNDRPDHFHIQAALQPQSVNRSYATGVSVHTPLLSNYSFHAGGAVRDAGDLRTPEGTLKNTGLFGLTASGGLSRVGEWGYAGVAAGWYESQYGIPGGFVGAHPNGVDIDMTRYNVDARAVFLNVKPHIPSLEVRGTYSWYHHQEFESNGILGIEFGVITYRGALTARTDGPGRLGEGTFRFSGEYRDYAAGGFSATPASREWTLAGAAVQRFDVGRLGLLGGLRYDVRRVEPSVTFTSVFLDGIRPRTFAGLSASGTASLSLVSGVAIGFTAMRSLRLPGIEELYSGGPHLAAYSYDIGGPDLGLEKGFGLEVFGRYETDETNLSLTLFRSAISGFIYPRNTGEINYRVYLPIYAYSGEDALMWGGEFRFDRTLARWLALETSGSYVQGTFSAESQPMPWIPPLRGKIGGRFTWGALSLQPYTRLAAAQSRLGPFEKRTDGYVTLGATAQYILTAAGLVHTVDLAVENLTDTAYRDHLSRVKIVMPEPGRNFRLLYRVYF